MALVVDDILFFPYRGIKWIFKEIAKIAEEELDSEPERITAQLSELYMLLETEKISEEEFAEQEAVLLDRLDELELEKEDQFEETEDESVEDTEEEGDWDEWDDWGNWEEEEDESDESPDSGESS